MEKCSAIQIKNPEQLRGKWLEIADGFSKLYLELGCGKGRFTAETAKTMPDTLFVALERIPDVMVIGMERVVSAEIQNVRFVDSDAARLQEIFESGEVGRIYINFCDPWPGNKHAKRRLTSSGFLNIYNNILAHDAEIHFKTDNLPLFEYSLKEFSENGFEIIEKTYNLHENGINGVMTDYEIKFHEQGIPINRCVVRRPASILAQGDDLDQEKEQKRNEHE